MSTTTHRICITLRKVKAHSTTPLFQFAIPIDITYSNKIGSDLMCKLLEQTANWALKTASISGVQELISNLSVTVSITTEE